MNKNANITHYVKKKRKKTNTLNWGSWNSGFVKLGVRWAESDNSFDDLALPSYMVLKYTVFF